jgi:two-component system response regulator YesN
MFNVMIVEDEMLVRMGFKNSIPWNKYGMKICADVANGKEAWDYYNEVMKPDIIITDIRMPYMDGMELIEKIRKNDSRTRIVILSCLEDFDLVRQAMKTGVSNYIVKLTMTEKEIDHVLLQICEELRTQKSIETSKGIIHNSDSLKENIVKNYMFYNLYSMDEFVYHIANLKLRLHTERLVVCMLEIDHFDKMQEKFRDQKGELIRATVLNVFNELLNQLGRGEVVPDGNHRYFFVFSFWDTMSERKIREELNSIFSQIQRALIRFFNISATVGISGMKSDYISLLELYEESLKSVSHKFLYGTGSILYLHDMDTKDTNNIKNRNLHDLYEKWSVLEKSEQKSLQSIVQAFLKTNDLCFKDDATKLFFRLLHWPSASALLDETEMTRLVSSFGGEIQKSETLSEFIDIFGSFINELLSLRVKKKQVSKEIAHVIEFIKDNYNENISLKKIADALELTPNYLSALFKKDLELTFSEYLNGIRLDKAKELLLNTNLRSYEIAEQIGFTDESYFSRSFKKHTDVRPNEFRRLWVNNALSGEDHTDEER